MSNEPLVSVIVPCYNHEKYVEKCISSIFDQTYKNLEVIIIDDYSTDKSVDVIKGLEDKYNFTFIQHDINWGLVKTLNDVIFNYAKGKYIKLIASDDYLSHDCIEILANTLEQSPDDYSFIYGKAQCVEFLSNEQQILHQIIGRSMQYDDLLLGTNNIPAPAVLFKRSNYLDAAGLPDLYIEDIYLWLLFTEQQKSKFIFLDKVVCYYQINNSSSLSANYLKMNATMIHIISNFFIKRENIKDSDFELYFDAIYQHYSAYKIGQVQYYLKKNKLKAMYLFFKNILLFLHGKRRIVLSFWFKLIS